MSHIDRERFNFIEQVLLWCAGTDKRVLMKVSAEDATETHKKITTGALILITSLTAWASFTWTMLMLIEAPTPPVIAVCIAAGLLVGLLSLFWDRELATAQTTLMAWFRIPMAIPISLFSAIPLMIFLMGGYLGDAEEENHRQQVEAAQDSLQNEAKGDIARYRNLQEEVDSLRAREQFYERMNQAEAGGLSMQEAGIPPSELERYGVSAPSGAPGCGVRCQRYQQESIVAGQEHQRKQAALGELRSPQTIRAENQNEINALEKSSPDIFSRLNLLMKQAVHDRMIGSAALIIVLIYLTFDLFPAISRILNKKSKYHRALAEIRATEEMKRSKREENREDERRMREEMRQTEEMKRRKRHWIERAETVQDVQAHVNGRASELLSARSSEPTGTKNPTDLNGEASSRSSPDNLEPNGPVKGNGEAQADAGTTVQANAQVGTPAKASERGPVPPVREDDSDSDSSRREGTVSSTYHPSWGNHWESSSTR